MSKLSSNPEVQLPNPSRYSLPVLPIGTAVYWQDIGEFFDGEHSSGVLKVVQAPQENDFDSIEDMINDGIYLLSDGRREVEAYRHELTVFEVAK